MTQTQATINAFLQKAINAAAVQFKSMPLSSFIVYWLLQFGSLSLNYSGLGYIFDLAPGFLAPFAAGLAAVKFIVEKKAASLLSELDLQVPVVPTIALAAVMFLSAIGLNLVGFSEKFKERLSAEALHDVRTENWEHHRRWEAKAREAISAALTAQLGEKKGEAANLRSVFAQGTPDDQLLNQAKRARLAEEIKALDGVRKFTANIGSLSPSVPVDDGQRAQSIEPISQLSSAASQLSLNDKLPPMPPPPPVAVNRVPWSLVLEGIQARKPSMLLVLGLAIGIEVVPFLFLRVSRRRVSPAERIRTLGEGVGSIWAVLASWFGGKQKSDHFAVAGPNAPDPEAPPHSSGSGADPFAAKPGAPTPNLIRVRSLSGTYARSFEAHSLPSPFPAHQLEALNPTIETEFSSDAGRALKVFGWCSPDATPLELSQDVRPLIDQGVELIVDIR